MTVITESYKELNHLKEYLNTVPRTILILFVIIVIFKFFTVFIGPFFTTDYQRNLFYGKAFWEYGFKVYNKTPIQIDPSYAIIDPTTQTLAYPKTTYDYPILQIVFWAGISILPVAFVLGKLCLTGIDFINFYLIRSLLKNDDSWTREGISWTYLVVGTIFSGIEGQAECITLLFMLLVLKTMEKSDLVPFLILGLGFLWKYIPAVLLVMLVLKYRTKPVLLAKGLAVFITTVVVVSIPALLTSDYIFRYVSYMGNLPNGQLPSNPMAWKYIFISSILLWIVLAYLGYYVVKHPDSVEKISTLGLLLLFLKYYMYAFPWYWLWLIPGIILLPEKLRTSVIKWLVIMLSFAVIDFIGLTAGWSYVLQFMGL